jgi:hypothetical protein
MQNRTPGQSFSNGHSLSADIATKIPLRFLRSMGEARCSVSMTLELRKHPKRAGKLKKIQVAGVEQAAGVCDAC